MTCKEVELWLLTTKAVATLPPKLERHLETCPACRQQQGQLRILDQRVAQLPVPPPSVDAKARLLGQLTRTAQKPLMDDGPPTLPFVRPQRWLPRYAAFAAAAAVLFAIGIFTGRQFDGQSTSMVKANGDKKDAKNVTTERRTDVIAMLVEIDAKLAKASSPREQFDYLNQTTTQLRSTGVHLARHGPLDDLPIIVEAHERVLKDGLLALADTLPKATRAADTSFIVGKLREAAAHPEAPAQEIVPLAVALLSRMRTSTTEALEALQEQRAAPKSSTTASWQPLTIALVGYGNQLALCSSKDPLTRAELSVDLATQVGHGVVLRAASDKDAAAVLCQKLAYLVNQGVGDNWIAAEGQKKDEKDVERLDNIRRKTIDLAVLLRANLANVPANPELTGALDSIDREVTRMSASPSAK
jgi:hypothetical protein